MKADPAVQRQLLELAKVDAELSRTAHRRRTLPEIAEIDAGEKTVRERRDALVSVQTAASDLDREIARQEKEIESVRARGDRDRKLLESGSVAAKQMTDIEHELNSLSRRQSALEDDLLELMERREALELDAQRTSAEVAKAEAEVAEAIGRRDEHFTDLDTTKARRDEDRAKLLPRFPEDLLKLYERVRAHKGIGAALLRARRCGACQLDIDRREIAEIKAAPEDNVIQCENCGAILVRTLESGL
ncbi:zinc ribbon domain-containing protein [Amycolatopsis sp. EV170708-02-1]|uniref:zinc ribbon domain-containing protein n=1 Tax=Amycolatopsis sp. EV170708-02-1 TaxID=2919322 RepID=UPI001F0CC61A|nr:C4-type zinc ribbon domain-containing protein [Amycolatopsis sp. EV170708-02-1]UMP01706.1 C4-type zinc ribbon domain-containing protein [Amycolatopsis sp. EV170708-02-1]